MRLELVVPPRLVTVGGSPALLLATRGDRSYVQVSRGPGLNHLRWVDAAAADSAAPAADGLTPAAGRVPRSLR